MTLLKLLIKRGNVDSDFQLSSGVISESAFEGRNGKKAAMLKSLGVLFRTPQLWSSVTDVGGRSSYSLNELAIAERALDKALRSLNAVRVEPGRYTVVLEPQATADLVDVLLMDERAVNREYAEDRRYGSPM